MIVSLSTPEEMASNNLEGISVWLYRVMRDQERLNTLPERIGSDLLKPPPLPLRLHYLMTPITEEASQTGPEMEQVILGKALQIFHDHSPLRGADLKDDFIGTNTELNVRLESLGLDEMSRVWEALDASYQLSLSYEVTAVNIDSALEPERISPVLAALPDYGVVVG